MKAKRVTMPEVKGMLIVRQRSLAIFGLPFRKPIIRVRQYIATEVTPACGLRVRWKTNLEAVARVFGLIKDVGTRAILL